ncbi:ABC transporter ATP-binding protein [Agromyces archimandritae]|uniref:ABC transporter ATP-binding protein n=1 Tax=Agromyces archimandritae TaxID=2781962 RepID=A0A975IN19_9MICO|nr:ATP-binding cassette domain-containing protein [Agromyces archimandritae]QTX04085.1 ABC transporter ATP-binding protein [Agromyces archimandritae]
MSLVVDHVTKEFKIRKGLSSRRLVAVDDVSFTLEPGKTIALVGESGSGKSTIAKMIMRLERPTTGTITVDGVSATAPGRRAQEYLHLVQMVYQDPFASLNPFHSIRHHIERPLRLHGRATSSAQAEPQVLDLLERVNLTPAELYADRNPHELSGGQRQRVAIARAIAPGAKYLVADEPVSMLDVSIRLSVLNLLARLQREDNLGVLYITHDLATARHFSDEIMVLYKGEVVEYGPSDEVILNPQHDYTKLLLSAAPEPANHGKLRDAVRRELAEEADAASGRASLIDVVTEEA